MVNRKTGHRLKRQFVDGGTGRAVERNDQVKGYETGSGDCIVLEPDEIEAAIPEGDKTLTIEGFVACSDIDTVYFDRPYYMAAGNEAAKETFALVRRAMQAGNVAAIGHAILFRRYRTVLLRAHEKGFYANTLSFDYEVRSAREAFSDIEDVRLEDEMMELAEHIIDKKSGHFDPATFEDRYDAALAELVKAKMKGGTIEAPKLKREEKVVDLMQALRESAGRSGGGKGSAKSRKAAARKTQSSGAKSKTTSGGARRKAI